MGNAEKPAESRAPASIETEIEATRERLAGTIDQLVYRASPKTIARREVASVKSMFVNADGSPRKDNIIKVVAGVAGFVALMVVIRKATN